MIGMMYWPKMKLNHRSLQQHHLRENVHEAHLEQETHTDLVGSGVRGLEAEGRHQEELGEQLEGQEVLDVAVLDQTQEGILRQNVLLEVVVVLGLRDGVSLDELEGIRQIVGHIEEADRL